MSNHKNKLRFSVALAAGVCVLAPASITHAQDSPLMMPGDAVVTGFSGAAPPGPAATVPRIDREGASAKIISLATLPGAPSGQMSVAAAKRRITAAEVGQVFAIALDDAGNGDAPNVYLGATSMFGLHIVEGNGTDRLENGEPGARFMDGQLGPDGAPGSIWRIDGSTGEITEFARLPGNVGPGVGDVVFDPGSRQFFASDLDTGLIHRIAEDGTVIDSFDHGIAGRTAEGLDELADDGARLDLEDAAFNANDPATWGYTQPDRRVWGMALRDGRLYYTVAGTSQVWSVGIAGDGSFAGDPKLEIEIKGLAGDGPVTDMLFDAQGRLYLSQRGTQKASFNFAEFAEPGQAAVLRYKPSSSGGTAWEPDPDSYAIGMPPEHNASNGGISLGYGHDDNGLAKPASCGETLWTTGGRLVSSEQDAEGLADVHGLQGNPASLVRPGNEPPETSWFIDYDGLVGDANKAGQMGDVEVFQPCSSTASIAAPPGNLPPGYVPLGEIPPDWPSDWPPPEFPFNTNLRLTKHATPGDCVQWFSGYVCRFTIRVRNTGPDNYFGHLLVKDTLPAVPAGVFFGMAPVPPWNCWSTGPAQLRCWRPNVFMAPGQSVVLQLSVWVQENYNQCRLRNIAEIEWAPGGTRWNTDPTDDRDGASANIPNPRCRPVHRPAGSIVHRPQGSVVHRPRGSIVHRPRGSAVHRPRGSIVHRPRGSDVHRPRGSIVHRPRGSDVHRPRGSIVHRPRGSDVHRPRGSIVHRPKGSVVHRPRGSIVHRPKGSVVHRPRGSRVHRPKGSIVHRSHNSNVHRPRGSRIRID